MKTEKIKGKQRIISLSISLFAKKGYTETTMTDIGRAVGMKAASLYAHISSKNELLVSICDDMEERLAVIVEEISSSEEEALVNFRKFVIHHITEVSRNQEQYFVFLKYWKAVDKKNQRKYQKSYEKYAHCLGTLLTNLLVRKHSSPCFNENYVQIIILQILNHLPRWITVENPTAEQIEQTADLFITRFLHGLKQQ